MKTALRTFLLSASLVSSLAASVPSSVYAARPTDRASQEALEDYHLKLARELMAQVKPGSIVQIVSRLAHLDAQLESHYLGFRLAPQTQSDLAHLYKYQLDLRAQIESENAVLLLQAARPIENVLDKNISDRAIAGLSSNRYQLNQIADNLKLIEEVLDDGHRDQKTHRLTDEAVQQLRSIEIVESVQVTDNKILVAVMKRVAEIDATSNMGVARLQIQAGRLPPKPTGPIVIDAGTDNPRLRFSLEIPKVCKDAF